MKAILEFNLPEEQAEHYCAVKGVDMLNVLWEMNTELRRLRKYTDLTSEQYEIVENIQQLLIHNLNYYEINLDK